MQTRKEKKCTFFYGSKLTDIGESAPMLLSRKNEAESIDATVKITGFPWSDDEVLIGWSADQTLPFIKDETVISTVTCETMTWQHILICIEETIVSLYVFGKRDFYSWGDFKRNQPFDPPSAN